MILHSLLYDFLQKKCTSPFWRATTIENNKFLKKLKLIFNSLSYKKTLHQIFRPGQVWSVPRTLIWPQTLLYIDRRRRSNFCDITGDLVPPLLLFNAQKKQIYLFCIPSIPEVEIQNIFVLLNGFSIWGVMIKNM